MTEPRAPERRVQAVAAMRVVTRAAIVWSWLLALVGVATFVGLLVAGAALPPPLPTLGLAVVLALCIGRVALYPGELAASAELAVLLCAVVAFRHDAPVTGPLLLGLLVGPLDRDHWRQRSFVRMAYNSGDRALASLGATGAFAATTALLGSSTGALVAATALAALVATAVDSMATVGLVVCLGGNVRAARRELLDVDALALPLAALGGAVGFLATGLGWWAAAPPLLALALVPELLQARARIPARFARNALLGLELVLVVIVLTIVSRPPSSATVAVVACLAVLVGRELVVDARVPVPPVLGVVVVVVAVSLPTNAGVFAGSLVAALATTTAWWSRRDRLSSAAMGGVVAAAIAGALAVLVARADVDGSVLSTILGLTASVAFGGVALLVARGRHRVEAAALLWTFPLAAAALGVAPVAVSHGAAGIAIAGLTLASSVGLATWCGSTPFRSRFLSRRLGDVRVRGRRAVAAVLGMTGATIAVFSVARGGNGATWLPWVGLATGEAAVAMGLFAVRQWRFAPRARVRDATLLLVVGALLAVLLVPLQVTR